MLGHGEAAWSPGGDRIAFGRATGLRSAPALVTIYVVNTDGSHVRQLTRPPHGYEDHLPTWSPDGQTIVFQRDTAGAVTGLTKLMAVDVVTGAERVVYRLPSWAPGSRYAAFGSEHVCITREASYGRARPAATAYVTTWRVPGV